MSLAAGVLSAALALPPQGLVAAYDFARVNLLNWSEDFANAAWGKVRVNFAVSKLTQDTTANASHDIRYQLSGIADNSPLTFFADLAPAEMRYVHLQVSTKGAIYPRVAYDLIDGTSVTVANSVLIAAHGVQNRPDGTKRCWITVNSVGTGGAALTAHVMLALNTTGPGTMFNGDGTSGVFLYRAQVSVNPTLEYERTTDEQTLLDRSVRLWPAPAARTNLLRWTEDFTQSVWVASGATLSDPGLTDPLTGAKAVRVTTTGADPFLFQHIPGIPSGLTVSMSVRVKAEGSLVGRQFRLYLYGTSGAAEAVGVSGYTFATGDWQTLTFTRTFPAGMASTSWVWRVDTFESGQQVGDTVLVAAPMVNYGPATLPYERQTDGVTYDLSQRGMRNLIPNSELARTSDTAAPTGWSVQIPSGVSASWSYGVAASGVPYVQLTLTGTVSATGAAFNIYMSPTGAGGVPVTPGIAYNSSVNITQVSGPAFQIQAGAHFWNTTGTYVGTAGAGASGVGDDPLRIAATVIAPSTAQYATPRLGALNFWPVESGQTRVYRISQPQFELGSTAATYQRGPSHGTLGSSTNPDSNDPAWTPQGLSFDGVDDFIAVPGAAGGTGETLIFRVPGNTNRAGEVATVYSQGQQSGGPTPYLWVYYVSNAITIQLADGQDRVTNSFSIVAPGTLVAITADYASGRIRYYENGMFKSAVTHVRPFLPVRSAVARIGCYATSLTHTASGTQSWLSRHTRALTDAEVHQAYRFIRNQLSRRGVTI